MRLSDCSTFHTQIALRYAWPWDCSPRSAQPRFALPFRALCRLAVSLVGSVNFAPFKIFEFQRNFCRDVPCRNPTSKPNPKPNLHPRNERRGAAKRRQRPKYHHQSRKHRRIRSSCLNLNRRRQSGQRGHPPSKLQNLRRRQSGRRGRPPSKPQNLRRRRNPPPSRCRPATNSSHRLARREGSVSVTPYFLARTLPPGPSRPRR